MTFEQLKEKARMLPSSPGVYLMLDKDENIIYIGKAKALKSRVSSYFSSSGEHSLKTIHLVSNIHEFQTIFASTEFDALLLESTLIKKHKPKYNILLKDDKGYPYVKLDKGEYPRFIVVSRRDGEGRFYGPFGGRGTTFAAIRTLSEVFRLPTCAKTFPRDIGKERPCLLFHLKKCCGVCTGDVTPEDFRKTLKQAEMLLEGKSDALEKAIEEDMLAAAENLEFEKAAMFRDRFAAVKRLRTNRIVIGATGADTDAISFTLRGTRGCVTVLSYAQGVLVDKKFRMFDGLDEIDAPDVLEAFIKQHYEFAAKPPGEVLVSHEIAESQGLGEYLSSIRQKKCRIYTPKKGEKLRFIELSKNNGNLELLGAEQREQKSKKTAELLQSILGLDAPPKRLEAYDISNTAGSDAVGSMVVFYEGKPYKKAYKRFKIKSATGGDDYGSMAEVLSRRLDRALNGDESFLPLADVMLIDGGQGHVSVAKKQLMQRGLNVPVYGMVKDDKHRTRALVATDGREIGISATVPVFALIGRIQEEVHRFAIEYHKALRNKQAKKSTLEEIEGIGQERRKKLLKEFKTVKAISEAEVSRLAEVVPLRVAEKIYSHFHADAQENE